MVAVGLPPGTEAKLRRAKYPPAVARVIDSAIGALSKRDSVKALQAWGEAMELAPESGLVALGRGLALLDLGQFQEALDDFTRATALSVPADFEVELRLARAVALHQEGRSREAVKDLDLLAASKDRDIEHLRRRIVDDVLSRLAAEGFGEWSGKRAHGSTNPAPISAGPPVSNYVIEDRR